MSNRTAAKVGLTRITDACNNRATEALRVVEDLARYLLDDAHLTDRLKQMRHQLATLMSSLDRDLERIAARDTAGDVGTSLSTSTEYLRDDVDSLWTANFRRLQQALRTLEETAKCQQPALAKQLEQLRYDAYSIEKAVFHTRRGLDRWNDCRIYALVEGHSDLATFDAEVQRLINASVDVIQLREKENDDRLLLAQVRLLVQATAALPIQVIINDRPDLAALSGADGVHLGQTDMAVRDARQILGTQGSIGVSTHSIDQARQAVMDGADYLGMGPVFASTTKEFTAWPGLEFIREVSQQINLPAFAIGGIDADNIHQVAAAGARRVAVHGALRSGDARETVATLRQSLELADQESNAPVK